MGQQLMRLDEVAEELNISKKTAAQNWHRWGLTPIRIGGGSTGALRFQRSDVDALIKRWTAYQPKTLAGGRQILR